MPQHRQLSAILFTDIEAYTAIMQHSEQRAMIIKDRHREILQKEHKQFNSRIIHEWNWQEAKKYFLKSIEVNPRYAEGHYRYGWNYLTCVEGKFEEAEKFPN